MIVLLLGICLYLIGVVIAWVLSIGSLASQCPSLTDPYESVREFPILWESCFDRQYNSTNQCEMMIIGYRVFSHYFLGVQSVA